MADHTYATPNIPVTVTPGSTCSLVSPTHVVGSGGVGLGGAGVVISSKPELISVVGGGGFYFEGEGVFTDVDPSLTEIGGDGGFTFGGDGAFGKLEVTRPEHKSFVGDGGFALEGEGVFTAVMPSDIPSSSIVGSKGIDFGGAGIVTTSKPQVKSLAGAGGFALGGFRIAEATVTRPDDETVAIGEMVAFALGGEGVWSDSKPGATSIATAGAIFKLAGAGGLSAKLPAAISIVGEGGFVLAGEGDDNIIFDAWVLSGNNFEPSYYSGFDFNSFAQFRGQFFGAKDDGLYLMGAADDDGEEIHSGVRIGPTNLGVLATKRLRSVTVGECGEKVKVRVQARGRTGIFPVVRGQATIARNLQDREMTIDIADFEQISQIEIIPLIMVWG